MSARDPLPLLLSLYEEYGPIFSTRLLHHPVIFMLGPEANHFITVAHPENFTGANRVRIAMRALLGLDPDEAGKGAAAAEHFERALGLPRA